MRCIASPTRTSILRLEILAGLAFTVTACPGRRESTIAAFLDDMKELALGPSLTVDKIRSTLAVDFTKDENSSHETVTFLIGKPLPRTRSGRLIERVDCRVPTAQNSVTAELFVVFELQPGQGTKDTVELKREDVVARFGQPDIFQPNLPENSESSASLIYKLGKRALWFSLGRRDEERVIAVSIHPADDAR